MNIDAVPSALKDRLGAEATGDLLHLLDIAHNERREDLITACTERFERRLVEEVAGLRVQNANTGSSIRQDMTQLGASLRQEMSQMGADLRQEMAKMGADLRQEMSQMGADLRQEMAQMRGDLLGQMAADRFDSLRWAFLFWIGQVVAIATLFGVMLRLGRAG
jgi:hypothetical protein